MVEVHLNVLIFNNLITTNGNELWNNVKNYLNSNLGDLKEFCYKKKSINTVI